MTDLTKLKELAERADALHGTPSLEHVFAITKFREALEPKAILGLIADLEDARNGMEYQPIMQLKNKIDRLKAENEALKDKLSDCAISLRGEMLNKYAGQNPEDMHPVTRRDYDRDMAEIAEYTAALEGVGR